MKVTLKLFLVFLFLSLLIVRPTPSYAWHGHSYVGVNLGVWPGNYYYGGPYYDPYYSPYSYPYSPAYTVVASSAYQPTVINGVTYYVNNGVYYIYTQYGYQAVATPAGISVPVVSSNPTTVTAGNDDSYTINVPNAKGGYTSVVLKRSGNGFTGPQGEFYSEFPKVSHLQVMYGK